MSRNFTILINLEKCILKMLIFVYKSIIISMEMIIMDLEKQYRPRLIDSKIEKYLKIFGY